MAHLTIIGTICSTHYTTNKEKGGNPQPSDPRKWTTPFLDAMETTVDHSILNFKDKLPTDASPIATIPPKMEDWDTARYQKCAALGAFAVPIARTILKALKGLKITSHPGRDTLQTSSEPSIPV